MLRSRGAAHQEGVSAAARTPPLVKCQAQSKLQNKLRSRVAAHQEGLSVAAKNMPLFKSQAQRKLQMSQETVCQSRRQLEALLRYKHALVDFLLYIQCMLYHHDRLGCM